MLTRGFWIHDEFKDVFIEVMNYYGKSHGMDVYGIEWWNRSASRSPWQIFERDMIGVAPEDYAKWKRYDPWTRERMEPVETGKDAPPEMTGP